MTEPHDAETEMDPELTPLSEETLASVDGGNGGSNPLYKGCEN